MLKVAFLFLTMANVYHEEYWHDFFRNHEEQCTILVDSKHGVSPSSWFKQFQMPYKVESSWARTMKAQITLLKEALKDPYNEMFVFCSYNSIPLQPFDFIYNELIDSRKTTFRYEKNPHTDPESKLYEPHRVIKHIPLEKHYKNTQWIILNRKHAQMMVDDKPIIDLITCYPHDQEHYPSMFLAMHNMLNEVHKCEKTMVVWHLNKRPPYVFKDLTIHQEYRLMIDAIKYGIFFARKIDEECNLSPLDDWLDYRSVSSESR